MSEGERDWRRDAYDFARVRLEAVASETESLFGFPRSLEAIASASGLVVVRDTIPEFKGRAVLVGRRIVLGDGLGSREARFSGFHEVGHFWLGTTHSVAELASGDGRSRAEEVMADAAAGALAAPHEELYRVLRAVLGQGSSAPVRPRSAYLWAAEEERSRAMSAVVQRFDVNYEVAIRALADAELVQDVIPWHEQTPVVEEYRSAWRRISQSHRWRADALERLAISGANAALGVEHDAAREQWLGRALRSGAVMIGENVDRMDARYLEDRCWAVVERRIGIPLPADGLGAGDRARALRLGLDVMERNLWTQPADPGTRRD